LNEKLKTEKLQNTQNSSKSKIISQKYQDIVAGYKKEIEKLKQSGGDGGNEKFEQKYKQSESFLASTISVLLNVIEIFISQRSHMHKDSILKTMSNHDVSCSSFEKFEIYDSYNMEDDKRTILIEQIQQIILSKLKFLQSVLGINLEKEIARVNSWGGMRDINMSLSNLSNIKGLKKENTKESISCKSLG
jgi:hypothetical protein